MRGTLYPVADLAVWMRCPREEVERLVKDDGLPIVDLPGGTRPKIKFAPRALCKWLNSRSTEAWTIDELIEDIDRAVQAEAKARKADKEAALVS